ncbi:hypothetical protein FQ707_14610 [Bacteroidaceae bacterium HV4-6-C5C]|nr:hypothetical protein FQ707_14610 [Bacteroidaceae bacterium HV4-6-C5C]
MKNHNCRVCGLYITTKPWGNDGQNPTFEICPCCGVEFGNEDYSLDSIRNFRKEWLGKGAPWFDPKQKPLNWKLEDQLQSIPDDYF